MNPLEILKTGDLVLVASLVPIIVGLVQVLKVARLPDRFAPAASIGCGLLLMYVFRDGLAPQVVFLFGILAGLSASGLYDVGKTTVAGQ